MSRDSWEGFNSQSFAEARSLAAASTHAPSPSGVDVFVATAVPAAVAEAATRISKTQGHEMCYLPLRMDEEQLSQMVLAPNGWQVDRSTIPTGHVRLRRVKALGE